MEAEVQAMKNKNIGLEEELKWLRDGVDFAKQMNAAVPPKASNPQVESLRQQLAGMHDSLQEVTDELSNAQKLSKIAQDSLNRAQQMRQEEFVGKHIRPAEELRATFANHGQLGALEELSDSTLAGIARAALTWAVKQNVVAEDKSDEPAEKVAMLGMLEKQRNDLEKMKSAVAKQEEQEKGLVSYLENQVDKTGKAKQEDVKKKLQDQLNRSLTMETELQRSFEESIGIGQQTYELRCVLHPLRERLDKVERQISRLQEKRARQEEEQGTLQEKLSQFLDALTRERSSATSVEVQDSTPLETLEGYGTPAAPAPRKRLAAANTKSQSSQTQVLLSELLAAEARQWEEQQKVGELQAAKLELQERCRTELQDARSKLRYLQEKYANSHQPHIDNQTAAENEDALLRPLEPESEEEETDIQDVADGMQHEVSSEAAGNEEAAEDEMPTSASHREASNRSDAQSRRTWKDLAGRAGGKEGYTFGDVSRAVAQDGYKFGDVARTVLGTGPQKEGGLETPIDLAEDDNFESPTFGEFSGMLYTQKIEELEALKNGLEQDVTLLQESAQMLRQDCVEKEAFITELMGRAAAEEIEMHCLERAETRKKPGRMRLLKRLKKERRGLQAEFDGLQHEAEEAMLDNIRLKNNLRMLAQELDQATQHLVK